MCRSVLIFLGAPLVAGIITRYGLIYAFGEKWCDFLPPSSILPSPTPAPQRITLHRYNEKFMPWFGPLALISLIYTIIVLFALQGHQVGGD